MFLTLLLVFCFGFYLISSLGFRLSILKSLMMRIQFLIFKMFDRNIPRD